MSVAQFSDLKWTGKGFSLRPRGWRKRRTFYENHLIDAINRQKCAIDDGKHDIQFPLNRYNNQTLKIQQKVFPSIYFFKRTLGFLFFLVRFFCGDFF